jgi:hypothetical protein
VDDRPTMTEVAERLFLISRSREQWIACYLFLDQNP